MDNINGHLSLILLKLLYQFKPLFAFLQHFIDNTVAFK